MNIEKICKNCKHWDNGECEVKYFNKRTHPYQRCNEVALTARESLDGVNREAYVVNMLPTEIIGKFIIDKRIIKKFRWANLNLIKNKNIK